MLCKTVQASFSSPDLDRNAVAAADRIKQELGDFPVAFLLVFAAAEEYDFPRLAERLQTAFPAAGILGCSTAGEICGGRSGEGSVTAQAFSPDAFASVEIAGVSHIDADAQAAHRLLDELGKKLNRDVGSLNYGEYFGFVLIDGLAKSMETSLERLGERTDIVLTGGCAGDRLRFRKTTVFCGGEVHENGMAAAILKPRGKWGVIKTQSVTPTSAVLTATRVDEENNVVHEFNGRPASQAYAQAVGLTVPELTQSVISASPLALMANGDPFIRSIAKVEEGGGLRLFLKPKPGMNYVVCKVRELVEDTRAALADKRRELGGISALVNVTCVLRKLQLLDEGAAGRHDELYAGLPNAGFYSFGEIYFGVVNQTSTIVALA